MWKSHPKALPFLFLSEMWERFGYYLMIGIFTLYLKDVEAGFSMTEKEASDLYGTFIALVFLTPFIGGLIADRYLGYKNSIVIGGILMGIGYFMMGIHNMTSLYIAMTFVIVGNGFFKPKTNSKIRKTKDTIFSTWESMLARLFAISLAQHYKLCWVGIMLLWPQELACLWV